jgi:hypothetical protein
MKKHFRQGLILAGSFLGALSVCVGQPEPKFTVLFPKDGPVTTGWVVRTWANVRRSEWERYGKCGRDPLRPRRHTKWVGTWLLGEHDRGDFAILG